MQAVWGDTVVEEGSLAQYISHLRKALGDNSEDTRLIVTIARRDTSSRRMSPLPNRRTPQYKLRFKSRPPKVR